IGPSTSPEIARADSTALELDSRFRRKESPVRDVVIASACRTPIAKFQGSLSGFRAPDLGALAIQEALRRANVPASVVEEVIFGNVLTAGLGQNPARQAAIKAGIP